MWSCGGSPDDAAIRERVGHAVDGGLGARPLGLVAHECDGLLQVFEESLGHAGLGLPQRCAAVDAGGLVSLNNSTLSLKQLGIMVRAQGYGAA